MTLNNDSLEQPHAQGVGELSSNYVEQQALGASKGPSSERDNQVELDEQRELGGIRIHDTVKNRPLDGGQCEVEAVVYRERQHRQSKKLPLTL